MGHTGSLLISMMFLLLDPDYHYHALSTAPMKSASMLQCPLLVLAHSVMLVSFVDLSTPPLLAHGLLFLQASITLILEKVQGWLRRHHYLYRQVFYFFLLCVGGGYNSEFSSRKQKTIHLIVK